MRIPKNRRPSPETDKRKADHYRLFNQALTTLYEPQVLALAGGVGRVEFNRDVFDRAVREVFARGGFSPDMLCRPAVRPLVEETYNALNRAVDTAINTETPPELTAALQNNAFIFSRLQDLPFTRRSALRSPMRTAM